MLTVVAGVILLIVTFPCFHIWFIFLKLVQLQLIVWYGLFAHKIQGIIILKLSDFIVDNISL